MTARSRASRVVARLVFSAVLAAQLACVVHAYSDAHKYFGYQPFPESSTFQATITRVTRDGRAHTIDGGWEGYRWDALVRSRGLDRPWERRHASYGVAATLDHLQDALDWVATHTPNDRATHHFEAEVITIRNRRAPVSHRLRSVARTVR